MANVKKKSETAKEEMRDPLEAAKNLISSGDYDRATALLKDLLKEAIKTEGELSLGALDINGLHAEALIGLEEWDEARSLTEDLIKRLDEEGADDEEGYIYLLRPLIKCLIYDGEYREAEKASERLIDYEELFEKEDIGFYQDLMSLADIKRHLRKSEDAILLSRRAWKGLRSTLGANNPKTLEAQKSLIDLLRKSGRKREAAEVGTEWLEHFLEEEGERSRTALKARETLAEIYAEAGDATMASSQMMEILMASIFSDSSPERGIQEYNRVLKKAIEMAAKLGSTEYLMMFGTLKAIEQSGPPSEEKKARSSKKKEEADEE